MEVRDRQQVGRLRLHPACLVEVLALRAVAVATGVVDRDVTAAVVTVDEMTTECGGPASPEVRYDPRLLRSEGRRSVGAEQIGQLDPGHECYFLRRRSSGFGSSWRKAREMCM
jgi:hypothetical protein